jgi:hypothetical protein
MHLGFLVLLGPSDLFHFTYHEAKEMDVWD